MVNNVTSLGRSGLHDWLLQRVSAIIIAAYSFILIGYVVLHQPLVYQDWHQLFSGISIKIFSFIFVLSIVLHARVGIWTVLTDYIKCVYLRVTLQVLLVVALMYYLIWVALILWGIQ